MRRDWYSDMLPIYNVTPFTLLDFPDKMAAIVWCAGCNMRCSYCHNPQIVRGKSGKKSKQEVLEFLEKRKDQLDGVVFSGGEATIWPGLPDFINDARDLGYAIKLDTNGTRPDMVDDLLSKGALDYVALDYKAPREKYITITKHKDFDAFHRTLEILCAQNKTKFEVRTTVHSALLDECDISQIMQDLKSLGYKGTYYIQEFQQGDGNIMDDIALLSKKLDRRILPTDCGFEVEFR